MISYGESIATGNTDYPWQATGWTNGGSVTRVGTYNAALAPLPLAAEASSGTGTKAAREDHVHPLPTPAQIGAEPAFAALPISKGGTGAGTAAGALTALGAVANGGGAATLRVLTQSAYNAIGTPDANTVYVLTA